jgi:glycosyltransferase involved in cell wall biosynthesis
MRICVDATALLLRSAGVKNYVYHWMKALQREARGHTITAFPLLGEVGDLNHETSMVNKWQTYPRLALLHLLNHTGTFGMDLLARNIDVFHASNQVHNPPRNTRLTATLYDMTCLLMPQNHTGGNVRAEQNFANKVLKRADGMIAISNHTRMDTVRLLGIDPEKIAVIYPGVPDSFFHVSDEDVAGARARYQLSRPYILFVGTVEPRKNLDALLDAYDGLTPSLREEFDLVVVGPRGWAAGTTMDRLDAGKAGVRYLGYLPEKDLPAVTAGARVFVYPSLYEGFGFPVAQAMAAGVAVITSNVSSLPEVARDGALLIDPRSVRELADALTKALTSPVLCERLGRRGAEVAREYTWKTAAQKSAEFFEHLR